MTVTRRATIERRAGSFEHGRLRFVLGFLPRPSRSRPSWRRWCRHARGAAHGQSATPLVEGPRGRSRSALAGADRRALLERLAVDEGRHWARGVRRSLVSEGRRVAGGWPGTLSEARSRVVTGCGRAMRESGQLEPSSAELDWMARRLNAAARHDWLAKAEREEAPDL